MPIRFVNEMTGGQVFGAVVQAGTIGSVHLPPVSTPPVRTPRQLPPAPVGFVNRSRELSLLEQLLTSGTDRTRVAVLSGLGGVGKTGLGVHWAHRVSDRFDGGQLYADLDVHRHRGGVEVGDVLGAFLRALGVNEEWMPSALSERATLYRSIVADRRMLVLLDNVDQASQVTPLVPGSPGSVVIAMSRRRLTSLLVSGATLVRLEPLNEEEGRRLLGAMLGTSAGAGTDTGTGTGEQATAQVVQLCGGLPIALRVCGARLVGRDRHAIDRLSAELADDERRLHRLAAEGKPIVEAVFDAAYAALPEEAALLYRGLGAHPGPELSREVVTVVADSLGIEPGGALEALLEASLLEEMASDRFRFHDLVRLHARARADESGDTGRGIVEWYLMRVRQADRSVFGGRLRLAPEVDEDLPGFDGPAAALDWLERERGNILAAVRLADRHEWFDLVWIFAEALWALYDNRTHHADEVEVARLGARAAARVGHRPAEARLNGQVIRALLRAGDLERAAQAAPEALAAAADCGNPRVESAVLETYGLVRLRLGEHEAAIDAFERSRAINAAAGNPRGVALQSYHLGIALTEAARPADAVRELTQAMQIMLDICDELSQAKIGIRLGEAYRDLGRQADAATALTRALERLAGRNMPLREARVLELLAELADDAESADALRHRARSLRAPLGPAES